MRSPIDRANANIVALRRLSDLRESGRAADASDIAALSHYSGWGGAPLAFDEGGRGGRRWAEVNEVVRGLLSDVEYAEARASALTAFYTPASVIEPIIGLFEELGYPTRGKGAEDVRFLEPGCGTGNFLAGIEASGAPWGADAVEVDRVSSEIAGHLNPRSNVVNASFDKVHLAPGSYDGIVGNVPFSDSIRFDAPEGDARSSVAIHDYFIERSVEALRPGGYAALITSRYTMDKANEATRRWIAQRAELVGAVRLPGETFAEQAGTTVVSDVLVLRKRESLLEGPDDPWIHVGGLNAPDGSVVPVNRYFIDNPESVIGSMGVASGRFGYGIQVDGDGAIEEIGVALHAALAGVAAEAVSAGKGYEGIGPRAAAPVCAVPPDAARASLSYTIDESGVVWYGDGDTVEAVDVPSADRGRLCAMVRLRDQQSALLDLERSTADEGAVAAAISTLDEAYEAFVSEYGNVSSAKNRRVWAICNDYSGAFLRSLEVTTPRDASWARATSWSAGFRRLPAGFPSTLTARATRSLPLSTTRSASTWRSSAASRAKMSRRCSKSLTTRSCATPSRALWCLPMRSCRATWEAS